MTGEAAAATAEESQSSYSTGSQKEENMRLPDQAFIRQSKGEENRGRGDHLIICWGGR